jgi:hypothetical protein
MACEDLNELGRLLIMLAGSICLYESLKELNSEFMWKDEGTDNEFPEYNPDASKGRP